MKIKLENIFSGTYGTEDLQMKPLLLVSILFILFRVHSEICYSYCPDWAGVKPKLLLVLSECVNHYTTEPLSLKPFYTIS